MGEYIIKIIDAEGRERRISPLLAKYAIQINGRNVIMNISSEDGTEITLTMDDESTSEELTDQE